VFGARHARHSPLPSAAWSFSPDRCLGAFLSSLCSWVKYKKRPDGHQEQKQWNFKATTTAQVRP